MTKLSYETRQLITNQALKEMQFARDYKQGKVGNWKINEDLYYGRKMKGEESRANVDLGQMASFVHTLLSKIDNPLTFKFTKRKESQLKRVKMLNSLRAIDAQNDNWDIKDIAGKKQAIIYGRSIFSYSSSSEDGVYKPNLENVDVYDFLIDPSGGGIDIEKAFFMGRYGVVKTKSDLKKGVKEGRYLRTETNTLIEGSGNADNMSMEETNKQNRTADTNSWLLNKEIGNPDKFKFWEWYTTYEGERYYLLLQEDGGVAVRVEPLKDMFSCNKFPFWTYAAFPDLTEFWTPSFCDYVRDIFMAEAVSINQMLDNAEQINKPQKLVNINAIKNLAELKYRRDGIIRTDRDISLNTAVQVMETRAIDSPIKVFQLLEGIQEKASGVTAGSKGLSDEDKVGIYEGNQANAADRFGFLNKSYSFGYKRMAELWEAGVRDNLVKKVAVDILGPDGVEIIEISRRDIFRKGDMFGTIVESNNAELALSEAEKRTKLTFLANQSANPVQNPQKAYEIQATIAGFDEGTIRQLQDTSDFGTAGIMSEAERDIEALLDGEKIKPNQAANTAYKQRFVDYMIDNQEKITEDQFMRLAAYIRSLDDVIMRNTVRDANQLLFKQQLAMLKEQPMGQQPQQVDVQKDVNITNTNGEVSPDQQPLEY